MSLLQEFSCGCSGLAPVMSPLESFGSVAVYYSRLLSSAVIPAICPHDDLVERDCSLESDLLFIQLLCILLVLVLGWILVSGFSILLCSDSTSQGFQFFAQILFSLGEGVLPLQVVSSILGCVSQYCPLFGLSSLSSS